MAEREAVDVVIVGAGAAASVFAATLAQRGRNVVVFETGPALQPRDLISSQIWSRRLKASASAVTARGVNPIAYHFNSGTGIGGSALHHYACWFRMHAEDCKVRSLYGQDLDWPIGYDDLRPYYDRVQRDVGISGDADAEVWRPPGEPYPMPPLPQFHQGELIAAGFAKRSIRTSPMPHAINSVPYRGRPACINDGWCDAGCPIGALANLLVVYFPVAIRAGAEIRARSTVTRILSNGAGDRVHGACLGNYLRPLRRRDRAVHGRNRRFAALARRVPKEIRAPILRQLSVAHRASRQAQRSARHRYGANRSLR